jgi:hypothetical protein
MQRIYRLSEMNILPSHPIISIGPIWIDGVCYELGDDGDTLIEMPEDEAQKASDRILAALDAKE